MNRAMFSGVAGLKAHQTKMDVIGNNIANVNTYGYKAQHAVFSDVFYQTLHGASAGTYATGTPTTATGGTNPSAVGYGSKLVAVRSDMSSSSLQSTGNSMDVAITGDATISRDNHAVISYNPKKHSFRLAPGDSRGLVYLNDEEVLTPIEVAPYDRIELGETLLLFVPFCGDHFTWPVADKPAEARS